MKAICLGLVASTVLLPIISFAQTAPQPPASWVAFQQQENAKRTAFNKQIMADREAFFNAHPEAKAYLEQMRANASARFAAWRAAHPKPNSPKI